MKTRSGFVSNSSSSSFVVAFPRVPKSAKEVQEMMFGDSPFLDNPYDEEKTKTKDIAETVWGDIKPQKRWKEKFRNERIKETVRGISDDELNYNDFTIVPDPITEVEYNGKIIVTARPREQVDWKRYGEACDVYAQRTVKALQKDWNGKVIYVFSYGDNDGDYFSNLEHGEIFKNLPHKQISNH